MAISISITSGTGYFGSVYTQTGAAGAGQWYADEDPISGQTGNTLTMQARYEGKAITFRTASPAEISNRIKLFVPSMIAGLVAQFDAARDDLMTFNANKVASWASSVGSLVFNQTTDANRPTWSATGRNSKPAVAGNGTSMFMTLSDPAALPQGTNPSAMAAMAYHPNLNAGAWTGIFVYGTSTVTTARQISKQDSTNRPGISLGSAGSHTFPATSPTWLDADKIVIGNFVSGAGVRFDAAIDGQYDGLSASTVTMSTPVPTIAQLFRFTNNSGYWPGSVQELLVWSANLSVADQEKLEGYLASKWGTRALLPAGHPYKSTNPAPGPVITVAGEGILPTAALVMAEVPQGDIDANGYLPTAAALMETVEDGPITISVTTGTGYAGSIYTRDQLSLGYWYVGGVQQPDQMGATLAMRSEWEGLTIQFRALNGRRSNRIDLFTPKDIPNLLCWFDAYSPNSFVKDGANAVSQWSSRFGSWTATQAVAASQPVYSDTGRNGLPALIADGSNDHLVINPSGTGLPTGFEKHTVFGVGYYGNLTPAAYRMLFKWGEPTARRGVAKDNNERVAIIGGSGSTNHASSTPWTNTDAIVVGGYEELGSQLNVNGGPDSIRVADYNNLQATEAYIFRDASVYWFGSAQEIIIYGNNRRISDEERQKLEGYAASKWGLRGKLPADHPYKFVNPPAPGATMAGAGYLPVTEIEVDNPTVFIGDWVGYLPTAEIVLAFPNNATMDFENYLPTAEVIAESRTRAWIETDGLLPTMEAEFEVQTRVWMDFENFLPTTEIVAEFPIRASIDANGYLPVAEIGGESVYGVEIDLENFLPTTEIVAEKFRWDITAEVEGLLPTAEIVMSVLPKIEIAAEGYLPFMQSQLEFPVRVEIEAVGILPTALAFGGPVIDLDIDLNGYLPFMQAELEVFKFEATIEATGYLPVAEIGGEAVYEVEIDGMGLLPTTEIVIDQPQTVNASIAGYGLLPTAEIVAEWRMAANVEGMGYLPTVEIETDTTMPILATLELHGFLPVGTGGAGFRPAANAPGTSTAATTLTVGGGAVLSRSGKLGIG